MPVAFLAGPMLQLANGLVDVERDIAGGAAGLVTRLGRSRAWWALLGLQLVVNSLATAIVFREGGGAVARVTVLLAFLVALYGVSMSGARQPQRREWGWRLQATSLALLAFGWLAWASARAAAPG
jgi:1,4-dihydroxy-2-naphthoate octaprenyltransferase